jgi:hypothetical protein
MPQVFKVWISECPSFSVKHYGNPTQISYGDVQSQEVEGKEQYRVEVSNRFVALEDLDAEVEVIKDNIKISSKENLGYFEWKKHESWFDEGCSKLLDQIKQAKLQWLQDPSEINGDNLNNVTAPKQSMPSTNNGTCRQRYQGIIPYTTYWKHWWHPELPQLRHTTFQYYKFLMTYTVKASLHRLQL